MRLGVGVSSASDPLTRQLEMWQPRTLLGVGDEASGLLRDFSEAKADCVLEIVETQSVEERLLSLQSEQRYDFALVAGYLEQVESAQGSAVIARLRDVLVRRLCVIVRTGKETERETSWSDAELSAFGLTLLSRFDDGGKTARLFGFDIASYKQTPDWLSSRHWAHPERWGKFRW